MKSSPMAPSATIHTAHPPDLAARLIRAARGLRRLKGWNRFADTLTPRTRCGRFTVAHNGLYFSGDLGVMIDRQVYLNGWYEDDLITLFLSRAPLNRRGVILDIGCNAGTHSLRFARAFQTVHAFDPNPKIWAQFESNIALNRLPNVVLHKVGLGRTDADLPFYSIDNQNDGLGTFSDSPQYDKPLERIGTARVVNGADYLTGLGVEKVDAIKIDVQGFEADVLEGLRPILQRDRPLVWVEAGGDAKDAIQSIDQMRAHFPYSIATLHFKGVRGALTHGWRLDDAEDTLCSGDYLVAPVV